MASEPLIVLATFAGMCLLAGWGLASIPKWRPFYGLAAGSAAFGVTLIAFAAYARLNRKE